MPTEIALNHLASMVFAIWADLPEGSALKAELDPTVRALYAALAVIRWPSNQGAPA